MCNKELFDDGEPVWLVGLSLGGYLAMRCVNTLTS
jgi:pimeloyl-ACP methyl ester carboxylesterase